MAMDGNHQTMSDADAEVIAAPLTGDPAAAGEPSAHHLPARRARLTRMSRPQRIFAAAAAAAGVVAIAVTAVIAWTGGDSPAIADPFTLPPRQMTGTIVPSTTIAFLPGVSATSTSIQLESSPPVPLAGEVPAAAPAAPASPAAPVSVNRPPLRTAPSGAAATVPDTVVGDTTPTTGTTTPGIIPTPGTTPTPVTTPPRGSTPTTAHPPPTTPVTTVPVVPRLTLQSLQLGVGLLGGEVRVQLAVTATALPTNQFGFNALSNVVVSAPLPAGVTLIADDNPAWTCTAQGACAILSLVGGKTSASVLRLSLAANVASPITFAPTVSNPAGAVVQSQPLLVATATIAGLQIQEYTRGSVATIGNTVLQDCVLSVCVPVDVDTDANSINSSTADLQFTGSVAKAVLAWSGDSPSVDRDKVTLMMPDGTTANLVADGVTADYSPEYTDEYVAYKDVTAQLTAGGTYGVANLQTASTSYGGWSLTILTHDPTQPQRSLMIALPLSYVTTLTPSSIAIGGSSSPAARVVVSAFEGDENLVGDTVTLGGLDVGGVDPFRGAISGVPRNPALLSNYRVDLLDVTAANLAAGASLDFASTDDPVMIAAVGIALDL